MKKKLRGLKRRAIQLDYDLYRVQVPIRGQPNMALSVIDLWPEEVEQTLMFVHGYAGCAETWEYQSNHFAREYRVVVPDLRGHGQSDAPYSSYTMQEMVEDLHAVVEHLKLPERIVLVGHSFGGSICVEYANAHSERLEKLILIASAGEYPLPRSAELALRVPTAVYRSFWQFRPRWNAEIHVMKRLMQNNMRHWNGWSLLRNITTPTLVITGERDTYFPREVFDDVVQMIPGAEVYDVGSAKHKVQLERHEAVNRAIGRFIKGDQHSSWREQSVPTELARQRPWLLSYSKDTPHTIPIPRQPLHKFLESAALGNPKYPAIIFYGTRLTYRQLNTQVNQFAHALWGLGVRPGDRVIVVLPNVPQMVIAYYATLKIGGVVVLPNPDADAQLIVQQIQKTGTKVLVTLSAYNRLAETIKQNTAVEALILADLRNVLSPGTFKKLSARWGDMAASEEPDRRVHPLGYLMSDLVQHAPEDAPDVQVSSQDLAAIVYTSGTTGDSRGVCLTHANLVANTLQTRHWIPGLSYGREVFLTVLPLLHSYGMTSAMNVPIMLGATIVLLPVFELDQVLKHIQTYKPTIFPGVPSMYTAINHAPNVRSYGLSSIKACISGAAPLPVEVQEAFEKLTRGRLVEGYGLTEASPVTHANPLYGVRKVGSIGIPVPNTDARIVDLATGETLLPGQIGELVVRGPQIMRGYWGDDSEADSESALKDGWLHTGDVALVDTDGYFQIIGRKRDTIMAGEYSVYPRDVEEVLYENTKVLEVAVVGVESAGSGQKVKAFVVPRPATHLSKDELLDLCRRRLAEYAVPWEIEFREELPKSFVGKVIRRLLVEEVNAPTPGENP